MSIDFTKIKYNFCCNLLQRIDTRLFKCMYCKATEIYISKLFVFFTKQRLYDIQRCLLR